MRVQVRVRPSLGDPRVERSYLEEGGDGVRKDNDDDNGRFGRRPLLTVTGAWGMRRRALKLHFMHHGSKRRPPDHVRYHWMLPLSLLSRHKHRYALADVHEPGLDFRQVSDRCPGRPLGPTVCTRRTPGPGVPGGPLCLCFHDHDLGRDGRDQSTPRSDVPATKDVLDLGVPCRHVDRRGRTEKSRVVLAGLLTGLTHRSGNPWAH